MALILEVLTATGGEVRARIALDRLPLSIGRALDNALILDDPHVDAHHARVTQDADGRLVIEDLGSVNGLRRAPRAPRDERLPLDAGLELSLGRTTLRVRDAAAPIPAALPLPEAADRDAGPVVGLEGAHEGPGKELAGTPLLVAGSLAAVAFVGLNGWLGSYERDAASGALSTAFGILLFAMFWGGIWALVGRLVVHRARFLTHLCIASVVMASITLLTALGEWGSFLFGGPKVWEGILGVIFLALGCVALVAHLRWATRASRRRRWTTGAIAVATVVAIAALFTAVEDEQYTSVAEFDGTIKPVPLALVPTRTPAAVTEALADLRSEVDSLAVEISARTAARNGGSPP